MQTARRLLLTLLLTGAPALRAASGQDLLKAADRGTAAAGQRLLEQGVPADVRNPRGQTPLMLAAGRGHLEVVGLLLVNGADVNLRDREGDTALKYAAWNDDVFVIEALLANGADVNAASEFNITPLRAAGADPNVRGHGLTALSFAQTREHHEIVRLLRQAGAME